MKMVKSKEYYKKHPIDATYRDKQPKIEEEFDFRNLDSNDVATFAQILKEGLIGKKKRYKNEESAKFAFFSAIRRAAIRREWPELADLLKERLKNKTIKEILKNLDEMYEDAVENKKFEK